MPGPGRRGQSHREPVRGQEDRGRGWRFGGRSAAVEEGCGRGRGCRERSVVNGGRGEGKEEEGAGDGMGEGKKREEE